MCGVTAVLLGDTKATTAAVDLHESLYFLQHRGQDAAGITVCQGGRVYQCKGNGMAAKVFAEGRRLQQLPGWSEAQPFYVNSPFGLTMSVNGNLVNTQYLREFLDVEARRHINSDSDSELLLNIFAHGLNELGKARANTDDIFTALGAKDYFLASESVALKQLGFGNIVDILPGQAVFIQKGGKVEFRQIVERKSYTPDIFELVYFARPDSSIYGLSVYRSRQNMGVKLAKKMREILGEKGIAEIDVVIPVPETSNIAAATLADRLGKPAEPVDQVFLLSQFYETLFSYYGIDLADPNDLVAHGKTRQEIAQHIHADEVIFQDLADLKASCIEAAEGPTEIEDFEVGVFCGKYVTDVPEGYFEHLSRLRGKERKTAACAIEAGEPGQGGHATVVTNSGPVNVASRRDADDDDDAGDDDDNENDSSRPEHREDISLYNIASELTVHEK
ncbi:putative amidophosphoribosyltransferase [Diaporthe ampelina]|uniref:Putative amidophosphoribosyltransferase n=1 Tax=Diaporthe ampelina TaxID=1214573 RepID=A0A0G2IEV2_9PEZI|nr:putative amidophosphoribosyltransferase [Diaporthe ampelina]